MAKLSVQTPFNIELEFETASVLKRGGAYFIDFLVAVFYVLIINLTILEEVSNFDEVWEASNLFLFILPLYFYHFLSEVLMNGQTLGKKALGIKVLNNNGNAASISQLLLRWILSITNIAFTFAPIWFWVSPVPVVIVLGLFAIPDLITVAANTRGKRLGDIAANTVVVSTKNVMDIEQTIFREVSTDLGYTPKYPEVMRLTDKDVNNIKNLLTQKRTKDLDAYAVRVSGRIEVVLNIVNQSQDPYIFFEELLFDYNYHTQSK